MKRIIENILETIRFIIGIAFIGAIISLFVVSIDQCDSQISAHQQSLPTYCVSYGNFMNRTTVNFETYKVENNHYTFFDSDGNLVGDFTVTGNNQISIVRNQK